METNKYFKGADFVLVHSLWAKDSSKVTSEIEASAFPMTLENGIATVAVKSLNDYVVLTVESKHIPLMMLHDASSGLLYLRARKEILSEIAELCKAQKRIFQQANGLLITSFDTDIWFELKSKYQVKPEGLAAKPAKKETPIKPVAEGSGGVKPVKRSNPSGVAAIAERLAKSGIKPAAKTEAEDSKKLSAKEFFKKS